MLLPSPNAHSPFPLSLNFQPWFLPSPYEFLGLFPFSQSGDMGPFNALIGYVVLDYHVPLKWNGFIC